MTFYNYVFCVVVYRNVNDLIELLNSIKNEVKESYHVIIVNNFFDIDSEEKIRKIAEEYKCDFVHSENKGYGAGNNIAISYALENYCFQYVIVANPDIIINRWDTPFLQHYAEEVGGIIAPDIITATGKIQNPHTVKYCLSAKKLVYVGLKNNNKLLLYVGIAIGKIQRAIFMKQFKGKNRDISSIYAAHGAFVIIGRESIEKIRAIQLYPIYDENMFLFAEEDVLAWKAKRANVKTNFTDRIKIYHKEDGSMKFRNDINEAVRNSCLYAYENYK